MGEYILGTDAEELKRLRLQQRVWGGVTSAFLDRVGPLAGAPGGGLSGGRALDVGCGPGLLLEELRGRVGESGEVVGLDEAAGYVAAARELAAERGLEGVRVEHATLDEFDLGEARYDLILLRWVIAFLPDPARHVARLARALRPGGVLAVQDYNHEGVSVFPESAGFRAVIDATRRLYATRGGDPWIAGALPRLYADAGLELVDLTPNAKAGGPGTGVFAWADAFFTYHAGRMAAAGVLDEADRERFHAEWDALRADPCGVFFSPLVVDVAGRRPA
jgi:SAM-dependent methyltransferase